MTGNSDPRICAATPGTIAVAADALRAGKLVAVPTETVYGLAARADDPNAVAAIYRAKGRPDFNPLIVHIREAAAAERLAIFDDRARALADSFWPGPLTLVLPLQEHAGLAPAVTAGLATVALRVPAHPVMQAVLAAAQLPLAAPSANRSGAVSPTRAEHVSASLRDGVAMILDAGACSQGLESTIVALRPGGGWQILRPGPLACETLVALIGEPTLGGATERIEAPGQLASHYAPGKPIRLGAVVAKPEEFYIGFGAECGDFNLSPSGDLAEAAARFYDSLHEAAKSRKPQIAVAPIPALGLGLAINDRLCRAAA